MATGGSPPAPRTPIAVGVHIFAKNEPTAVDNYFIYLSIDDSLSEVIKNLKTKHKNLKDRALKHGIITYEIEICVFEKATKRMVTIDDEGGWEHGKHLSSKDEADIHVKLFDVMSTKKPELQADIDVIQKEKSKSDLEPGPVKKKMKSSSHNHRSETKAKIELWKKLKNNKKSIYRTEKEEDLLKEFTNDIKAFDSSVALDEMRVECGICHKIISLNKVRARGFFLKNHFNNCKSAHEKQSKLPYCFKKQIDKESNDEEETETRWKPASNVNTQNSSLFSGCTDISQLESDSTSCVLDNTLFCELPNDILSPELPNTVNDLPVCNIFSNTNNDVTTNNYNDKKETNIQSIDTRDLNLKFEDSTHLNTDSLDSDIDNTDATNVAISTFNDDSDYSCNDESDSCSDYELHDSKYVSEERNLPRQMSDPAYDPGFPRYIFVDNVVQKLDFLIRENILPEDHIYYLLMRDINNCIWHYSIEHKNDNVKFQWDPLIIDWCNTVLYLGGKRTYNFIRGPANFSKGKMGTFDTSRYNIPLPDERTCRRNSPGFTTQPGIVLGLLNYFIKAIVKKIDPLFENDNVCLFGVSMGRDGMGLKPELTFDPIRKVLVGVINPIDLEYIKNNPAPDPKTLKRNMIKDVDTLVLTDISNNISLPVGLDYSTHFQTGEEVFDLIQERTTEVQTCLNCLDLCMKTEMIILKKSGCISVCDICITNKTVCAKCLEDGQIHTEPQLRQCRKCVQDGKKCTKLVVLSIIHDCEQKNKTAMEILLTKKSAGNLNANMRMTSVGPDAVHVGKCLLGSFANWWLLVDNFRICLVMLRTLRNNLNKLGLQLKECISIESVQRKDRQSTESVAEVCSPKLLSVLSNTTEQVVCTIVPEQFRKCEDNVINALSEPVGICRSYEASVFLVVDRTGKLVSIRLHYPAEVKTLQEKLSFPVAVIEVLGVAIIAEQGKKRLSYVDWKSNLKIDINKADKKMLQKIASKMEIPGCQRLKVTDLRREIKERKKDQGQSSKLSSIKSFVCDIDIDQPAALEKTVDDHIFVSNLSNKKIFEIGVEKKMANDFGSYILEGTCLSVIDVNMMTLCYGLAYSSNVLFVADHSAGILKVDLTTRNVDELQLSQDDQDGTLYKPHGITIIDDNIIFTDLQNKRIFCIENACKVAEDNLLYAAPILVSGQDSNVDGVGTETTFLQPTGICHEGNTLMLIDSGNKSVCLVSSLRPLIKYLSVIQKLYKTFSVHPEIIGSGTSKDVQKGIKNLTEIKLFLDEMNSEAKSLLNLTINSLQGPQGAPAAKTVKSVGILQNLLHHLEDTVMQNNTLSNDINLKSQLTLVNENLHSILRLRTETPTVLDCSRDFIKGVVETVKKQSLSGFHYFTSSKKHNFYELQHFFRCAELPQIKREKPCKLTENDVKELLRYRELFGKGVRQRSVRADTTKYNAGTMPLNLYTKEKVIGSPVNFQGGYNEQPEKRTTDRQSTKQKTVQQELTCLHDIEDVFVVKLENVLYIGVLVEKVTDITKSYAMDLYEENTESIFKYVGKNVVSADCIFEELATESYKKIEDDAYTLNEDVLNMIKYSKSEEHLTITEQIEELEDDINVTYIDHESRSGRKRMAPRRYEDFYYF